MKSLPSRMHIIKQTFNCTFFMNKIIEQNYFILLSEIPADYEDNWVSIYVDEELLIGPSRFNENRISYDLNDEATQNSTLLREGKHKLTLRIHAENERHDILDLKDSIAYKEIDYTVEK